MSPRPLYAAALDAQDEQRLARAKFSEPDPEEGYLQRLRAEALKTERAERRRASRTDRREARRLEKEEKRRKKRDSERHRELRAERKDSVRDPLAERQVETDADEALRAIAREPSLLRARDEQARARRAEWMRVLSRRFTDVQIANRVGVCVDTVARWRCAAGLKSRYFLEAQERREKAHELVGQGVAVADIAKRLGVVTNDVHHMLRRPGRIHLPGPNGGLCGVPYVRTVAEGDVKQATCGRCLRAHTEMGVGAPPPYLRWGTDALRGLAENIRAELARREVQS